MLIFLALIEVSIAFMISRVEDAYAPYSLGHLARHLRQRLPADLAVAVHRGAGGAHVARGGVAIAAAPEPLPTAAIATIAYYLGTASLVGFLGQYFRQASAWQEFRSRIELEREHERNEELRRQLERLSREDPLTGLANRRCWDETLAREFERSRRQDGQAGGDPLRPRPAQGHERPLSVTPRRPRAQGDRRRAARAGARERPGRAARRRRVRRAVPGHRAGERERRWPRSCARAWPS